MRIMSLDVGSRTIGIACSDALLMTAQGINIVEHLWKKTLIAYKNSFLNMKYMNLW